MKRIILVVVAVMFVCFAGSVASAEVLLAKHDPATEMVTEKVEVAKEEAKTFSVSGQIEVTAPNVSKFTGGQSGNGALTQPGLTLTHNPSGAYVSLLGYISSHGVDEVDLYLGKVTEWNGMTIDTGVAFYNAEKLGNFDSDQLGVYVGIDFPEVVGIIPIAYIEADLPIHKEFGDGGWLWKVGAKKTVTIGGGYTIKELASVKDPKDLPAKGTDVSFKIEFGGNDGIYGSEPKLVSFGRGTVSTELTVLGLKLSPWVALQKGFGGIAEDKWRFVAGLVLAF